MSSRSAAAIKVPLWRTLAEASRQVFGQITRLVRIGWIPLLILTLLGVAEQIADVDHLGPPIEASGGSALDLRASLLLTTIGLVVLLLTLACYCAFAAGWYRTVLRAGEDARSQCGYWSAFWRVLGYSFLALLAIVISLLPSSVVAGIGMATVQLAGPQWAWLVHIWVAGAIFIGFLCCFLLIIRFSLVFPAAAYGKRLGLGASWRRMRGNTWRLICALVLITILAFAIQMIPAFAFNGDAILDLLSGRSPQFDARHPALSIAIGVVGQCVQFLYAALGTSITAIFYREIVLRPGPEVVEVFA